MPQHVTPARQPRDPETLLHLLGATIRQYRQRQGLTQTGLATKTGLDNWYLSQIEQGQRNLSILSLVRIADALGLTVSHLLTPLETSHAPSPAPE